jgi:glycosyltransferase involved in cell wall biosynthesis
VSENHVLIIAYAFPPIAYVGTYRTLRFCKYLPESGWVPQILTVNFIKDLDNDADLLEQIPECAKVYRTPIIDFWRTWNSLKKKRNGRQGKKMQGEKQDTSGKAAGRTGLSVFKKWIWELLTIPDHMVFWVPFALIKGAGIIRDNKNIKIIYTTSPPHSEHIIGLLLSRFFRIPWIVDFRDPMLDSSGYKPESALRAWVDRFLERTFVSHASKLLIISGYYKELMTHRYAPFSDKFITLPNGYDSTDYADMPAEKFDKFTIIYSGSFYANRTPAFFLKGFHSWFLQKSQEHQEDIQVFFYGLPSEEVREFVRENSLESVIFTPGLIPKSQLIPKLKGADLLLLIIGFDHQSRGTVTSKIFEYMACNRPVLAIMPEGDALDILKTCRTFYWIPSEDEQLLHRCLDQAYEGHLHESAGPLPAQVPDINKFDAKVQTRVLADLFSSLLQNSKKLSPRKIPLRHPREGGDPERLEKTGFPPPRE